MLSRPQVLHAYFQPLEWSVAGREDNACYAKMVIDARDPDPTKQRVLGLHFLGLPALSFEWMSMRIVCLAEQGRMLAR